MSINFDNRSFVSQGDIFIFNFEKFTDNGVIVGTYTSTETPDNVSMIDVPFHHIEYNIQECHGAAFSIAISIRSRPCDYSYFLYDIWSGIYYYEDNSFQLQGSRTYVNQNSLTPILVGSLACLKFTQIKA